MKHYVYVAFRPNGVPFYIGKGTGYRAFRPHGSHFNAVVAKAGGSVPIAVIRDGLAEAEAYEVEEALIRAIGIEREGGPLINQGYGGRGGPVGIKHTEEWCGIRSSRAKELWSKPEYRAVMLRPDRKRSGNKQQRTEQFRQTVSEANQGNTHTLGMRHTDESRAKMSKAHKGRPKPPGFGEKIRKALSGRKRPKEVGEKIRAALIGRKRSPEASAKSAAANRGKKRSAEFCARISEAHRGKKMSPESIAKMANALRGRKCPQVAEANRRRKGIPKPDGFGAKVAASNRLRAKS